MNARRVLMTADTVGGVWSYCMELAQALPEVDFALATMGQPVGADQRREAARLPNVSLFPSGYALEWMDDPWTDVDRAGEWLLEVAAEFRPDVVHLNGYAHAALPWSLPVIVVAHSCVLSWWTAVRGSGAPKEYDEYRERVRAGLEAADLVIAPTAAMLESLRANYAYASSGRVIPNARDRQAFRAGEKQAVIFSAGRFWDDAKNLRALDQVAPRVRWPITVAGDLTQPGGAQREPRNVRSLGRLTNAELAKQLASAAIYALPARYEPFGLSALEAALSGCALVLGAIASLREVWGDAAIFVDPDDSEALARALNHLIENDRLRADFADRAQRRASQYSPERMADGYRAAYAECLARHSSQVAA